MQGVRNRGSSDKTRLLTSESIIKLKLRFLSSIHWIFIFSLFRLKHRAVSLYLSKVRLTLWCPPPTSTPMHTLNPAFREGYRLTNTSGPLSSLGLSLACLLPSPKGPCHSPAPTCLCCLWSPAMPAFLLLVHSGQNLTPTPAMVENVFVASLLCGGLQGAMGTGPPPPFVVVEQAWRSRMLR